MVKRSADRLFQPAVSSDCATNFWVGDSYCVGTGAAVASSASKTAAHTTVHSSADEPTQTGTICNCNQWYDIVTGDTCASVEAAFGITNDQFIAWNVSNDGVPMTKFAN